MFNRYKAFFAGMGVVSIKCASQLRCLGVWGEAKLLLPMDGLEGQGLLHFFRLATSRHQIHSNDGSDSRGQIQ